MKLCHPRMWLSAAFVFAIGSAAQTPADMPADVKDLALGKRLFESQCALCHGQTGTGGRGPALNRPKLDKAPDAKTLAKLITEGSGEMPGAWQLSAREVASVGAYVRSLGAIAAEKLPGDAQRGAALYRSKGCPGCHIVAGDGSGFGPELTAIGARRNASHLRQALVDPGAFVPEDYVTVEATTAAGTTVRGVRANEDSFSIQIRNAEGRFVSLRKSELQSLQKPRGKSLMPPYASQMQAGELDDLVAYLASLRGRP